ncbi:MAG: UvrD-helicase domain-containing protein [Chlamydiota bacterium]
MLATLNPEQKKAVQTTSGKVLVLAGAGSGKTSVLACRIAYLIEVLKVDPQKILGLTFTNKAAKEMKQRVGKFISSKVAEQVTLCTFHSFCMQLLRKEIHHLGFTSQFSLYDEKDVKRVLTHIVRHSLEHEGDLPSLQATIQKIAHSKNQGLTEIEDEDEVPGSWSQNFNKDLLQRLHLCMRSYNAVDFDSLLTLTVQLFEEHPEVLEKFQQKYQYIMIDEYQDTNPVQYKLAKLLSEKYNNLCVVGDDDQSIYGWRGAEIKNILNFPSDTTIKLEQNYRSTPHILQAANHLIAHNTERHRKELWSNQTASEPIVLFHAPTELEEAQSIAERLVWYRKNKNLRWKDMAILYRSNALSRTFETTLTQAAWEENGVWKRGIPYEVFGGTEFYERAEIKDLLAYLRIIENPEDEEALLRVINVPRRGISEKCLDLLTQHNRSQGIPLWDVLLSSTDLFSPLRDELSLKALTGIENFLALIQRTKEKFEKGPLHKTLEAFIEEIEYKKSIREEAKSEKMREFKWDNVLSCIDALRSYEEEKLKDPLDPTPTLQDFLSTTLLQSQPSPKKLKEDMDDKVHLMTIHSAKGLEFEVCFLVCLENHLMPHEKSVSQSGLEEERRLMYVAMTRAKRHLILSMARERKKMGKKIVTAPSRFLFEIPQTLLKIISYQTLDV